MGLSLHFRPPVSKVQSTVPGIGMFCKPAFMPGLLDVSSLMGEMKSLTNIKKWWWVLGREIMECYGNVKQGAHLLPRQGRCSRISDV